MAKSLKRKFKAIHEIIYASVPSSLQTVDGNNSNGEDTPAGEDATGGAPEGASTASAAAPEAARGKAVATRVKGSGRG